MPLTSDIAIELGRQRLRAVQVRRSGRIARIRRALSEPIPPGMVLEDSQMVGRWIGQRLRDAGFPSGRVTLAISRDRVGLKRMDLPTLDADELADMTRLAMRRELPFDSDAAVIDFVPVGRNGQSTTVLAVAAPGDLIERARQSMSAADLGIEQISLRSLGTAALIAGMGLSPDDAVLAIDVTGESVELSVISDGAIRFSRSPELPELTDPRALAEAVITETRRTWMSYRVVQDHHALTRAVLIGDPSVCRRAAGPIGELLGIETTVLEAHPLVEPPADGEMDGVWPLAGLMLTDTLGLEGIDLASPRRAPDHAARRRQKILALIALLIVVCGAAWTLGHQRALRREHRAATLLKEAQAELPVHDRFQRDQFKLDHLQHWLSASVDWLDHAADIMSQLPVSQELVIDGFSGTLSSNIKWSRKDGWTAPIEIRLTLEGEARQRSIADLLRDRLVVDQAYQVSSSGAETVGGKRLPHGFTFQLRALESHGRTSAATLVPDGARPQKSTHRSTSGATKSGASTQRGATTHGGATGQSEGRS